MTSAFHRFLKNSLQEPEVAALAPEAYPEEQYLSYGCDHVESETEDEEVKITCMGGLRGVDDSDMNSTFSSDEESDDESVRSGQSERELPLTFIANHRYSKTTPLRPRPTFISERLSPSLESDEEGFGSSVGKCSVGARGVPLYLDTDEDSVCSNTCCPNEEKMETSVHDTESCESDESCTENEEDEKTDDEGDDASSESSEQEEDESWSSDESEELCSMTSALSEESESLLNEEENSPEGMLVGASQDQDADCFAHQTTLNSKWLKSPKNVRKVEDSEKDHSFKRRKISFCSEPGLPFLNFSIGDSVSDQVLLQTSSLVPSVVTNVTNLCSSDDEEELDGQLREELDCCQSEGGDKSPVPLLTPPVSPCPRADEWEHPTATVCEWPSNLVLDSTITVFLSDIRPLSPVSLAKSNISHCDLSKLVHDNSSLTPLLSGMVVRQF